MNHVVFAVPGDLATPTGGFVYDARIVEGLRARGWTVDVADLGAHFPYPDGPALHFARNAFAKMRMGGVLVVDGLAFGVMPETAPALAGRHRLIALVHHPLAFETGVSAEDAARFRESERAALACAHHVIVTSPSTARLLTAEYDVRAENITVIRPGNVRAAPHPPRAADGKNVELLAVGSLVPRKGYDVLIAALATLAELPWRLTIVGERRDEATAKAIDAAIARLRLGSRVRMVGAVPAEKLSAFYREADLFVLASRFEGYGMAYSEAIAHGLPVIGTKAGAVPDTVPEGAGLLVPPDDAAALAEALRKMIVDADLRARLRDGAAKAAAALPTWDDAVASFARAIETVGGADPS